MRNSHRFKYPWQVRIPEPRLDLDNGEGSFEADLDNGCLDYEVMTSDGEIEEHTMDLDEAAAFLKGAESHFLLEEDQSSGSLGILTDLREGAPIKPVARGELNRIPYRTVGRFRLGCTGTLVGPRQILTAAHCVYDKTDNKYYRPFSLRFRRARYGGYSWGQLLQFSHVYVPRRYTKDHLDTYDNENE